MSVTRRQLGCLVSWAQAVSKDEGDLCLWVGLHSKGKMCWVMFRWLDLTLLCPERGAGSVIPDPCLHLGVLSHHPR